MQKNLLTYFLLFFYVSVDQGLALQSTGQFSKFLSHDACLAGQSDRDNAAKFSAAIRKLLLSERREFAHFKINPHYRISIAKYRLFLKIKTTSFKEFSISKNIFDILL